MKRLLGILYCRLTRRHRWRWAGDWSGVSPHVEYWEKCNRCGVERLVSAL